MKQPTTLSEFKDQVAKEYGFDDYESITHSGFDMIIIAKDRFNAYQLECKDKEIEDFKENLAKWMRNQFFNPEKL